MDVLFGERLATTTRNWMAQRERWCLKLDGTTEKGPMAAIDLASKNKKEKVKEKER
jgi:hypothetical protein